MGRHEDTSAGKNQPTPADNTDRTPKGKHDHDSGVNPTMGSTYQPRHGHEPKHGK